MANKPSFNEMPHSLEAEQALLGCLLLDSKIQVEVAAFLKEDNFYAESHKYIFSAMDSIIKKNQAVDIVTLTDALEKSGTLENAGGIDYIAELTNVMPSSANYKRYLDIVLRDSTLREVIRGATQIISDCQTSQDKDKSLAFAEKTVYDISNNSDTSELVRIDSVLPDVLNKFDELSKDQSKFKGIKTGYKGLDHILNGLHNSDLMILAARPAVGKTSFAMNIVENVALQGYSCAVFSLEMGKDQLVQRMICTVAGVSMEHAMKGKMDKTEWLKIAKAKTLLNNAKIYIDDSAIITPREMISKCRRMKNKVGLDLVMVDYIQLMSPDKSRNSDNRQTEITDISRNLKILAKEVNVPVLALSQLSRAVETRKGRPQLADLRESGAIEQDADIVMFIHRPDKNATESEIEQGKVQKNVAEIIIEKHRNGPTGLVKLYFNGECTKFVNLNEETGEVETEDGEKPEQKTEINSPDLKDLPVAEAVPFDNNLPEPPPENEDDFYDIAPKGNDNENSEKTVDDEIF